MREFSRSGERTTTAALAAAVNAPLQTDLDYDNREEEAMQAQEAAADREQTRREEQAKAAAKRRLEGAPTVASFCKLKREPGQPWGVRVPLPSNDANPGEVVLVRTSKGKESRIRLGNEVVQFNDAILFTIGEEIRDDRKRPDFPQVPEGRYAIDTKDGTNEIAFYHVDHGKAGTKWEGYTFVTLHTGGGDQRMSKDASRSILERIAEDPAAASRRYGQELGQCGVCGAELTNDESRAYGIGPKCRRKMEW